LQVFISLKIKKIHSVFPAAPAGAAVKVPVKFRGNGLDILWRRGIFILKII
jgi:hypothetical protein